MWVEPGNEANIQALSINLIPLAFLAIVPRATLHASSLRLFRLLVVDLTSSFLAFGNKLTRPLYTRLEGCMAAW